MGNDEEEIFGSDTQLYTFLLQIKVSWEAQCFNIPAFEDDCKGLEYKNWISKNYIYNIQLGKTSHVEDMFTFVESTTITVLGTLRSN